MSCRNTPYGSSSTTFWTKASGFHDRQVTSIYHSLLREAPSPEDLPAFRAQTISAQYQLALNTMRNKLSEEQGWSESVKRKATEKLDTVVSLGTPTKLDIEYAFAYMPIKIEKAVQDFKNMFNAIATRDDLTPESISKEWDRLYSENIETPTEFNKTFISRLGLRYGNLPQDNRSKYILEILKDSLRCGTCGQYVSTSHEILIQHYCPTIIDPILDPNRIAISIENPDISETPFPAPNEAMEDEEYEEENLEIRIDDDIYIRANQESSNDSEPLISTAYNGEPVTPWSMEEFQAIYDEAKARIENGDYALPRNFAYEKRPGLITGGLGAKEGGNRFGIEIEIDFPEDEYPYNARNLFASKLYEEGVTLSDEVKRWHYVGDGDRPGGTYKVTPNSWVCEFDRSVDDVDGQRGVEIKSQILYDEPATWTNLEKICRIASKLGGKPTMRTGLHVNVGGTKFANNDPTKHNNLLRLAGAYDDVLLRLAHNPLSGPEHRGRKYCHYVDVPLEGFQDVSTAKTYSNHYQSFNLTALPARGESHISSSRIEHRIWDSTLDVGRIQTAITASLAMVALAIDDAAPGQNIETAGTHKLKQGRKTLSGQEWEEGTESFRRFVALMGKAGADTAHHLNSFTTLFASTKWQKGIL
jgi:hypothetical protein